MSIAPPQRFTVELSQGAVAGWRWRQEGPPPLLFCHATGFCASAYTQMLAPLSSAFDVWAIDMRGHGRTTLPADPRTLKSWDVYARDIADFIQEVDLGAPWRLAGHSCGAVSAAIAASGSNKIASLSLIEPVATPPWMRFWAHFPVWMLLAPRLRLVRGALARRANWPTREDALTGYARKALFAAWAPGVLDNYLEDGLREEGHGVALSCDPRWEAATYQAQRHDFWGAAAANSTKISVLAAEHQGSTVSPAAKQRFRRLGIPVASLPAGHLLPMENPGGAAEFIARTARR